jgi:hypothetical protein
VPDNSAVRTLLRDVESAKPGAAMNAMNCLNVAQALQGLGYLRTALVYYVEGTRREYEDNLILEPDGFALETHRMLMAAWRQPAIQPGRLIVAHNKQTAVTFTMGPGGDSSRVLYAEHPLRDPTLLYRELSTSKSSGILDATDRWFEMPHEELCDLGLRNQSKPLRPLTQQPRKGQLELFIG